MTSINDRYIVINDKLVMANFTNYELKKLILEGGNMPIALAPQNVPLHIVKILVDEKTKKHLESLGIAINSVITVLSHSGASTIVLVKDGRLALDSNIATKILVA